MDKMLRLIQYFFLCTTACWCQMLPPCPPYAAFLPPELLVGCTFPGPPQMQMHPGFPPPPPYPMYPPMMPPIINVTLPNNNNRNHQEQRKTTTPPPNKFSFPVPLPPMPMPPMPFPGPMPMPPPMPYPGMPMMPPMHMPPAGIVIPATPKSVSKENNKDHVNPVASKSNLGVTPVLSYVTQDGHIIYKKTLSDVEALRWLKKEIKKIRNQKSPPKKQKDDSENKAPTEEEIKN